MSYLAQPIGSGVSCIVLEVAPTYTVAVVQEDSVDPRTVTVTSPDAGISCNLRRSYARITIGDVGESGTTAVATQGGGVAQGRGAVAAGAGGIAVGGSLRGDIRLGPQGPRVGNQDIRPRAGEIRITVPSDVEVSVPQGVRFSVEGNVTVFRG